MKHNLLRGGTSLLSHTHTQVQRVMVTITLFLQSTGFIILFIKAFGMKGSGVEKRGLVRLGN